MRSSWHFHETQLLSRDFQTDGAKHRKVLHVVGRGQREGRRVNFGLGEIRISSLWRESDTGSHRATKISKARWVIIFHKFSLLQIKIYNDSLSSSHREEVNYGEKDVWLILLALYVIN